MSNNLESNKTRLQFLIEDLYIRDQSGWASYTDIKKLYENVIIPNTNQVEQVIAKYGFIDPKKYGERAAHMFYMLILHADFNKKLQKEYLEWLKQNNLQDPKTGGLDIYNLEKRINGIEFEKHILSINAEQMLKKQITQYRLFSPVPYFPKVPFRVAFSTNLFGEFSYKYDINNEVAGNRSLFLRHIKHVEKHVITVSIQNSDSSIILSDWFKNRSQPCDKYNFMLTRTELENLGLGVDAVIMDTFNVQDKEIIKSSLGLSIFVGDCYAVFFYDPKIKIWGAIHVGNNAITKDLIGKVFNVLIDHFRVNISDLYVFISPGIKSYGYIYENVDKFKNAKWWEGFIKEVDFSKGYTRPKFGGVTNREQIPTNNEQYLLGLSKITKLDSLPYELKSKILHKGKKLTEQDLALIMESARVTEYDIDKLPKKGFQLHLYGALRNRLIKAGVKFDNIRTSSIDTLTSTLVPTHFGSYHLKEQGLKDSRFVVHGEVLSTF